MSPKHYLLFIAIVVCFCGVTASAQSYAITGAKIVTVSGPTIENGTVVIRNGLIESVGSDVKIPADAALIDGKGLTVYPGFIDSLTNVGMPNTPARTGGQATASAGQQAIASNSNYPDGLRPEDSAFDELKAGEQQFEALRNSGVTTALITGRSGIFTGRSVLIDLAGDTVSAMVVRPDLAFHVTFTTIGGGQYPGSLLGTFAALRQLFYDAKRQQIIEKQYAANPKGIRRPQADRSLDALIPAINREMPVVFNANSEREIIRALDLIKELDLKGIIAGGLESGKVADRLKAQNVPVLLSINFPKRTTSNSAEADPESLETLRQRAEAPKAPAKLAAAGVKFAFQSGGAAAAADLFTNAGKAVENGLAKDAAIRAMTLGSAEILGVADRLGSIEPGKIANIAVVRGDVFAKERFVRHIFIDGKHFEPKEPVKPPTGTSSPTAPVPNISGVYTINIDIPGQPAGATLNFVHQGNTLTGTMVSQFGTTQITDGKVTADGFTFTGQIEFGGTTIEISVRGKVTGDQISGTVESPQGNVPFSGTKNP
jgi:imidazolonepropionase-like amidohydrolase